MRTFSIQPELRSTNNKESLRDGKFNGPSKYFTATAIIFTSIALSINCVSYGQTTSEWQTLGDAPITSRHNDVYFVTPNLGWIVNGSGQIYKTRDGGNSWQLQFEQNSTHFRSVGFFDSLRGWAGNVGFGEFGTTDTTVLYHTTDGGDIWSPFNTFTGPKPKGLCGMYVVNDSVICAVGRVRGPAFFAKTTDAGNTWTSKDMSAHAAGLIDVYFFHPDSGFAVGLTNTEHSNSSGVVLFTSDGGETWEERINTDRTGEWCWKISFPSRQVGYVSLQRNSRAPIYFLKTADGGKTWESKLFFQTRYFVQGIGFVTEELGWIGGNSTFPVYQTADGGETWQPTNFGTRVNRFRFLGDSLGYAVGSTVYKYSPRSPVSVAADAGEIPATFELKQNYPNPFNPSTNIEFSLPGSGAVRLNIYDMLGRRVTTLINERLAPGRYVVQWDGTNDQEERVASGSYIYQLNVDEQVKHQKMLLVK
ncbi:T9SS type A sorting domain-containing protein [candidate division KSB1 bacterium]|nr:T9SS type A sorting domain-containing protein [candidate division KSB1 bacterium]NIT71852.1 T9SS type A sorting domain-containing protein [candidate division KSB1 bacterium]NIX71532.1 T9SS type A sorting domain-containing protein [candidate division KSB1 bacterium]